MIDHTKTQTVKAHSLTASLVNTVIDHFCTAYSARADYVKGNDCRWQRVLDARFGAIWVLKELTGAHNDVLAAHFKRSRTSIVNALQKAEDWRKTDRIFLGHTDMILAKMKEA